MADASGMASAGQDHDEQAYYQAPDEEEGQGPEESMETQLQQQPQPVEESGVEGDTPAADGDGGGNVATFAGEQIPYDDHKLFVGGLSWETDEKSLKEYFSKYGEVSEINLKFDQATKRSRGFGFVVFTDEAAVTGVLSTGPHTIDGRQVDAKKAIPHQIHQALKHRTKKIFVGGVPTDMPEETIRHYFEQFGEIDEVALVTDKGTQRRRGFVFITFGNEDSVDKCTDKTFHTLEGHQVEVKRATPREQNPAGPLPRGRGRGGGYGRAGWNPYGHFGYYGGSGGYPYGGGGGYGNYGGYGNGGGGGWGGYGGYGGFEQYGPYGGGGRGGFGSRYGPVKQNYNHGGYHPYQR